MAAGFSLSRIKGDLTSQTLSTHARHHCALRFEARIGLAPMIAKTGCVWDEGKTRSAIQELRGIGVLKLMVRGLPSAISVVLSATQPLTMSSTGTMSVVPIRARSRCQRLRPCLY